MKIKTLLIITLLTINLSNAQEEDDKSIGIEDALHGEYVQSFKVKKNGKVLISQSSSSQIKFEDASFPGALKSCPFNLPEAEANGSTYCSISRQAQLRKLEIEGKTYILHVEKSTDFTGDKLYEKAEIAELKEDGTYKEYKELDEDSLFFYPTELNQVTGEKKSPCDSLKPGEIPDDCIDEDSTFQGHTDKDYPTPYPEGYKKDSNTPKGPSTKN